MTTMLTGPADAPEKSTTGPANNAPATRPAKSRRRPARRDKKAQMAVPERLKSGKYRGYVWDADLQEKVWAENGDGGTTFKTKSECRAAQRALLKSLDELYKTAGSPLVRQTHRHPFEEVAREWHALYGGTRASKANIGSVVNVLCREFAGRDVADIEEADYLAFMREEEKVGRASATIAQRLIYMKQIMEYARKKPRHYITDNPVEGIELPKVHRVKDPRVLDNETFLALMEHVPDEFAPAFYLGYDEGLRAGEVAGLRWKRLDLDGDEPKVLVKDVIERGAGGKKLREHTKGGGEDEWITLTPRTVEALKVQRASRPDDGPDDFVFRNTRGNPLCPTYPSRYMAKAWAASKLTGDRPTFHSLRHSCATNMAEAGVAAHVIMERMRHRSFDVTLRYIKKASLKAQRAATALVEEMHAARAAAARRKRQEGAAAVEPVATPEGVVISHEQFEMWQAFLKITEQLKSAERTAELVAA